MNEANAGRVVNTVKVWDAVVRAFHWLLVVAFVIAWSTGDDLKDLHQIAGYAIAFLLVIRVVWGFIGSTHARFSDFVFHPTVVILNLIDTMRLRARRSLGHSPAGGAMVIVLLVILTVTCATGIMMTTDAFWDFKWVEDTHETVANLTVVLIGFHLAGVSLASLKHRENLVAAMFTGRKRREPQ